MTSVTFSVALDNLSVAAVTLAIRSPSFENGFPDNAPSKIAFLLSDDFPIILLKKFDKPVNNSFASSKSPIISRQV